MNNQVNEILHKEIDIIQECIKRMADCSFKLKFDKIKGKEIIKEVSCQKGY